MKIIHIFSKRNNNNKKLSKRNIDYSLRMMIKQSIKLKLYNLVLSD